MDMFEGAQAWYCGDLDSCGQQVVTIVLGAGGGQRPMCLEHLWTYLVSIGQHLQPIG